jgi:hypothetical protein
MSDAVEFTVDALSSQTVKVLKGLLEARGLKVGGRKAELVERLLAFEAQRDASSSSSSATSAGDAVDADADAAFTDAVTEAPSDDCVATASAVEPLSPIVSASPETQATVCTAVADALIGEVVEELVVGAFDEVFDSTLDEEQSSKTSLEMYIRQSTGGADSTGEIALVQQQQQLQEASDDIYDDDCDGGEEAPLSESDKSAMCEPAPAPAAPEPAPAPTPAPAASKRVSSATFAQSLLSPTMLICGGDNLPMILHTASGMSSASVSPMESPYQQPSSAPSSAPSAQPSPIAAPAPALCIGARVSAMVKDKRQLGVVKYVGATSFEKGEWCGLQLDDAAGNHDGTVQAVRYFHCPPKHGVFVRPAAVTVLVDDAPSKKTPTSAGKPLSTKQASLSNVDANAAAAAVAGKFAVGQRVSIKGRAEHAVVKYVGAVKFAEEGEWLGLQLKQATGKNDGSVKGERYFDCPPKTGLFVRPDAVTLIGGSGSGSGGNR